MRAFAPRPDAKTERMKTALETVGIDEDSWSDSTAVHRKIAPFHGQSRIFIDREMGRFCQKFTNRRGMPNSPKRTGFVLSKLAAAGAYYLWDNNSASAQANQ